MMLRPVLCFHCRSEVWESITKIEMDIMEQATKISMQISIYEIFWPELASLWGDQKSKPLKVDKLIRALSFSGLPFPFHKQHKLQRAGSFLWSMMRNLVTVLSKHCWNKGPLGLSFKLISAYSARELTRIPWQGSENNLNVLKQAQELFWLRQLSHSLWWAKNHYIKLWQPNV